MSGGGFLGSLYLRAILVASLPAALIAHAAESLPDYVTKPIEWRTADGAPQKPIHVNLLPDGRLFFFDPAFTMTPTPFWIWSDADLPDFVTIAPELPPLAHYFPGVHYDTWHVTDSISCAGHTLAEDGSVMVFGGTRLVGDGPIDFSEDLGMGNLAAIFGFPDALSYSPASNTWSTLPNMIGIGETNYQGPGARWYPTATRLADGRIMVTSGLEVVLPVQLQNRSVEIYDPAANAWQVLSTHGETPLAIYNRDYSHVFQLPGSVDEPFDMLMMGELAQPAFLSTQGPERWRLSNAKRPGSEGLMMPNHGTTTALLPIRLQNEWGYSNGAIVMAGGQHMTSLEHSIDVYDPAADQWMPSIDMGINRHHGSTVLLPDSRVLLIAGHNDFGLNPGYAQYLDPADGFSLTSGSVEIPETRGYHTITALLPDGRVFLGGGADGGSAGTEKPNFRYYYPDYMLKPRPSLLLAQDTFQLGSYFWVLTGEETPIAELVLVALGATTHSYDMNQRLVEMEIVQRADYGEHTLPIGRAPQSAATAPPGNYMLFALDQERVPSVAKIITLTC
ncbi:MAG: galactose oxidase early set domain-containing protein [Gammaproteobacteria bacterium]|nr:galactose oxidase early set domain-containing protein [Gammaproteobacteria bacterium]